MKYKPINKTTGEEHICEKVVLDGWELGFIEGYNKSQETHPFSEEDVIDFATFRNGGDVREEFNLWKEQRTKTLYYE